MPRFVMTCAMVLFTAMGTLRAADAPPVLPPALPPDVVAADTVMVVHMDSYRFNPDQLQSAATAVLEEDAKEVDEPLKKFKEIFTKVSDAGAVAVTMVFGAAKKTERPDETPGKYDNGIVYIAIKPDADVKGLEKMMTDKLTERGDKEGTIVFEQSGGWLAIHEKTQAFPVKPDPVREALFADALKSINRASIQIAFIPDDETRDKMRKSAGESPKGRKDIAPVLSNSKWMALAVTLGEAPAITASANLANEDDAKELTDDINDEFADIKAQAAKPGPLMLARPLIEHVIDSLRITQASTHVSLTMETESLKLIADFMATMRRFTGGR